MQFSHNLSFTSSLYFPIPFLRYNFPNVTKKAPYRT